jgi:hypothetical protein
MTAGKRPAARYDLTLAVAGHDHPGIHSFVIWTPIGSAFVASECASVLED